MNAALLNVVSRLSIDERLDLIGRLWDGLVDDGCDPPLSPAQEAELDRRLDALERNGSRGVPFAQVTAEIIMRATSGESAKIKSP